MKIFNEMIVWNFPKFLSYTWISMTNLYSCGRSKYEPLNIHILIPKTCDSFTFMASLTQKML
jgi:hypothetical protein